MNKREQSFSTIKNLVEKYNSNKAVYRSNGYHETRLRSDFISPFLKALGWDVDNEENKLQHLRDVVEEDTVEVSEESGEITKKKPDYSIRVNNARKFFVEVKKPSVKIENNNKAAFQTRRYAWNANLPVSILTNFEHVAIYDGNTQPNIEDDVRNSRLKIYSIEELLTNFEDFYNLFSKEAVLSGEFDRNFVSVQQKGNESFDEYFLKQIEKWRLIIATNLLKNNKEINQDEISYLTQRLINRIMFLRICEDREIEKYRSLYSIRNYEELKKVFFDADRKYNSSLFNFIEDELSMNMKLDDEVLVSIFKELYFPDSPYVFSVVESHVLGEIYEQFLAKEIIVEKDRVDIIPKPEVVESNGVVTTPNYIVKEIIDRTFKDLFNKELDEIRKVKICDISCGSGIFLIEAFNYLVNNLTSYYFKQGPEHFPEEIYTTGNNQWFLTLKEKNRILQENLFGVDIDEQAVEVARFSLLLKILEGENSEGIKEYLIKYKEQVLPNINGNIQWGNSLVDDEYYSFKSNRELTEKQLVEINPFDWEMNFFEYFGEEGFDYVIGNPPYIRIQNIVKYSPLEVAYYKSKKSPYFSSKEENFDKYSLFIERGLQLLKPDGRLGYIVPNKFLTLKSGKAIRKILASGRHLSELVNFGVQQVFKGRSTYTCIIILDKERSNNILVENVTDLNNWKYIRDNKDISIHDSANYQDEKKQWVFLSTNTKEVLEKIENENKITIKDVSKPFVGVQTSCDEVFIINPISEDNEYVDFIDSLGRQRRVERKILQPMLYDQELELFKTPAINAYAIFPYKEFVGKKAIMYTLDEMKNLFPQCLEYLNDYKEKLLGRKTPNLDETNFYKYGRSQSLSKFQGEEKLVWTVLSLEPRYIYDADNLMFTGGGNGPYYGLRPNSPDEKHSLMYIYAIITHPVTEAFLRAGMTSYFGGGYYSHGKQFIENLPFRAIDFQNSEEVVKHNEIVELVQEIIDVYSRRDMIGSPRLKVLLARQAHVLKKKLHSIVFDLYGLNQIERNIIENM